MAAIDQTLVSNILNATLPTATGAKPTATYWTGGGLATSGGMYIRLDSTNPTASAMGTQLANGFGYTTKGAQLATACTASSAGSAVTIPNSADISLTSWTNSAGGSGWSIMGLDITDAAATPIRAWFAYFNGTSSGTVAISVANLNTFAIAAGAITVSLS